jgi:hypothetical protein
MNSVRLTVSALLVALVMSGSATSPAGAAAPAEDTWVGQVQRHDDHYDYVGRACPESSEICADYVAHYRIVPLNPAARRAVRGLAGGQARLYGRLEPSRGPGHNGTLLVRKAERPTPGVR